MNDFRAAVHDLFCRAVSVTAGERAVVLAGATPEVRAEVESLLAANDSAGDFLEQPVFTMVESARHRMAGTTVGPYRLVRELGRGGMGTVYLGRRDDGQFAHRVAVKVVRRGEVFVERFRQERQILAALEHPNIARLIDGGTTADGLSYLVMEYVDGIQIDEYAAGLPLSEKLALFLQVCGAVQYAHRALVIHRDIKPANVLVTPDGVAKLLDFGIAKLATGESSSSDTRVMTPQYASPEQLYGGPVTTASDVYSLGILLYILLTGKPPFDANRTIDSVPVAPSIAANSRAFRGDLDGIVLTALERDPQQRYGSVERFEGDLRLFLTGRPVSIRRSSVSYRARRFVRRHAASVIAGAAALIVAIAGFTVTLQQKKLAERRFDQVRSLARAVVFDLHDAIVPLPGSTHARAVLVSRALGYLDALADEASDNRELQRELIEAYLRVGDVQGLPYQANLGDTSGALASYEKAAKLAQILSRDDEPASLALLATAYDRVGLVQQRAFRWAEALRAHERARQIRESLPPDATRDVALARTWTAIGDARYIGAGTIPRELVQGTALDAYRRSLAILERLPAGGAQEKERLMELGRVHQRLGGYYSGPQTEDRKLALAHHHAALEALEKRSRLAPDDTVARRNWADQSVMTATAHNNFGDGASALRSIEPVLPILESLAAADRDNVEARNDLAFAHGERGTALAILGRQREAVAALETAVAMRRRIVADDPSNRESQRDLRQAEGRLAAARASKL